MKEKFTLLELLNNGRLFLLSKKKMKICSISSAGFVVVEEFIVDDIPYRLLRKEVVQTNCYNGVIEIYIK